DGLRPLTDNDVRAVSAPTDGQVDRDLSSRVVRQTQQRWRLGSRDLRLQDVLPIGRLDLAERILGPRMEDPGGRHPVVPLDLVQRVVERVDGRRPTVLTEADLVHAGS